MRLLIAALIGFLSMWPIASLMVYFVGNGLLTDVVATGIGFIGIPALILWLWKPKYGSPDGKGLYPEALFIVTVDSSEIKVKKPDGSTQQIALKDLREITIVTNSSGPWGMDVWWVCSGGESHEDVVFPGGATGESDILKWTETLQDFNTKLFIEAMGCTWEKRFVCWKAA